MTDLTWYLWGIGMFAVGVVIGVYTIPAVKYMWKTRGKDPSHD